LRFGRPSILLLGITVGTLAADCGVGGVGLDGDWNIEYRDFHLRLAGSVTRAEDESPVVGATVSGVWGVVAGGPVTTDQDGHYFLHVIARCFPSSCVGPSLLAEADGFNQGLEPQVRELTRLPASESDTVPLDFSLRPLRAVEVVVQGTVTQGVGGSPLAGATVTAREGLWTYQTIIDSTTTDESGAYELVFDDQCAVAGSLCLFSLNIRAESGSRLQTRDFPDLDAVGESVLLRADFSNLQ